MKILIKGFKKALTELKLFYFTSFIVALLVIIPISNFLLEGVQYVVSGNFSLGITGGEEVLETLKVLVLTSFFGGGLGTLNGWLLSNCDFKFRKVLRICQLIPLAAPSIPNNCCFAGFRKYFWVSSNRFMVGGINTFNFYLSICIHSC